MMHGNYKKYLALTQTKLSKKNYNVPNFMKWFLSFHLGNTIFEYGRSIYEYMKSLIEHPKTSEKIAREVPVKKYLYVMRAMACCLSLQTDRLPPLDAWQNISFLSDDLQKFFKFCVEKKQATEKTLTERFPNFDKEVEGVYKKFSSMKNITDSSLDKVQMDEMIISVRRYGFESIV